MAKRTTPAAAILAAFLFCAFCPSCGTFAVRPRFERFRGSMRFDTDLRDGRYDVRLTARRVEVSFAKKGMEWFFDGGSLELDDGEDSRLDADGIDFGFGVRTAAPGKGGWFPDIGVRLGYHDLDFSRKARAVDPDWEYNGYEARAGVGAGHAFALPGGLLLAFTGGVYFMETAESLDEGVEAAALAVENFLGHGGANPSGGEDDRWRGDRKRSDYDLLSAGGYFGIKLYRPENTSFTLSAGIFGGTSRVQGYGLSALVRF